MPALINNWNEEVNREAILMGFVRAEAPAIFPSCFAVNVLLLGKVLLQVFVRIHNNRIYG